MLSSRLLFAGVLKQDACSTYTYRRLLSTASVIHSKNTPYSLLNPPTSTLPAPLDVPSRKPDQGQGAYLFSVGRSYLKFYKTGLRAVWDNHKAASAVLKQHNLSRAEAKTREAAAEGKISRAEWQLIRRSTGDSRRIPLFILLFAVCGEFTPLVVVFAGALVPRTCFIPKQVEMERKKRAERTKLSFDDVGEERLLSGGEAAAWEVGKMPRMQLLHIGRRLDLYGRIWDLIGGFPSPLLKSRVERHLSYLEVDDRMLRERGGAEALSDDELKIACEDRGVGVLGASGQEHASSALKKRLGAWLEMAVKYPVTRLILSDNATWKKLGANIE